MAIDVIYASRLECNTSWLLWKLSVPSAALEVATGKIIDVCQPRDRHAPVRVTVF